MRQLRDAYRRSRALCALAVAVVIALGLTSRSAASPFPAALGEYPGDALWALMVFVALCCAWPSVSTRRLACGALALSFTVEFTQLYRASWINELRDTRLGALALGSGFDAFDLVAYAIGIAFGAGLDALITHRFSRAGDRTSDVR